MIILLEKDIFCKDDRKVHLLFYLRVLIEKRIMLKILDDG